MELRSIPRKKSLGLNEEDEGKAIKKWQISCGYIYNQVEFPYKEVAEKSNTFYLFANQRKSDRNNVVEEADLAELNRNLNAFKRAAEKILSTVFSAEISEPVGDTSTHLGRAMKANERTKFVCGFIGVFPEVPRRYNGLKKSSYLKETIGVSVKKSTLKDDFEVSINVYKGQFNIY